MEGNAHSEDEKNMDDFFKNLEKNIENHSKTMNSKNICSFLWLPETQLVKKKTKIK